MNSHLDRLLKRITWGHVVGVLLGALIGVAAAALAYWGTPR